MKSLSFQAWSNIGSLSRVAKASGPPGNKVAVAAAGLENALLLSPPNNEKSFWGKSGSELINGASLNDCPEGPATIGELSEMEGLREFAWK